LADIDAGRRQLNNNDLRAQYNDVVVPLNLDEMMTAIKHNQQNDFLYKVHRHATPSPTRTALTPV
jgi:hypothetical protein